MSDEDEQPAARRSDPSRPDRPADNSLGRLLTLSDGIFAISMTLLALDLQVPDLGSHPSDASLRHALAANNASYLSFLLTFYVVAGYWRQHRRLLRSVVTTHSALIRDTLALLLFVAAIALSSQPARPLRQRADLVGYLRRRECPRHLQLDRHERRCSQARTGRPQRPGHGRLHTRLPGLDQLRGVPACHTRRVCSRQQGSLHPVATACSRGVDVGAASRPPPRSTRECNATQAHWRPALGRPDCCPHRDRTRSFAKALWGWRSS